MITTEELKALNIQGVTADSRHVKDGYLFAALEGEHFDGRNYIDKAIKAGAKAILYEENSFVKKMKQKYDKSDLHWLTSENARQDFSFVASAFFHDQPSHIAAVTGTNGKTSVAHFVHQLLELSGIKNSAYMGTLGVYTQKGQSVDISMTTPDPALLHETLMHMHSEYQTDYLALEASSHGLDQYRMDGLKISAAGFTNFSHDHLDYHRTMEAYFEAKARLFSEVLDQGGVAVLNADVAEYSKLKALCQNRDIRVLSYGTKGQDIKLVARRPYAQGQKIDVHYHGEVITLDLPLVGAFQAINILCAVGLASVLYKESIIPDLLIQTQKIKGVPGRLEYIEGHPDGGIYVDYAHTPDALETAIKALRPHTEGRLICLIGCGGDRDKTKRPVMGRIASQLADVAIITDDNPRTENPSTIREEMMRGADDKNTFNIDGRRKAIDYGVQLMRKGDIFLVAGKGHEDGQTIGHKVYPFNDANEIRQSLQKNFHPHSHTHSHSNS